MERRLAFDVAIPITFQRATPRRNAGAFPFVLCESITSLRRYCPAPLLASSETSCLMDLLRPVLPGKEATAQVRPVAVWCRLRGRLRIVSCR
jgi:hypothetical protein